MISFRCEPCGKNLQAKDELAGKKIKCPGCGQPVPVPRLSITPVSSRPAKPSGATKERSSPPRDDDPGSVSQASVSGAEGPTEQGSGPQSKPTRRLPRRPTSSELTDFLAPPQAPDELGRLGSYRVLEVLGSGGMGVVFRAEDPLLKRPVALKAMLPTLAASASARQRFLREAQATAAIKHDHIVTIFQVGEDRGAPFLAMELLEGEPLDQRYMRERKLPLREVLRIGREMAEGLAAAHERGLIHRDIKPPNVWLEGKRGRVKILDFGLARPTADQGLTQVGAIVGTPGFMAPEQLQGKPVGPSSDLFSLGCVLYCLATGKLAFKGNDTVSTLMAVATEQPPAPRAVNPQLPEELSDLVMKLLAKDPANRYASAQEVADAIEALEASLSAGSSATLATAQTLQQRKAPAPDTLIQKPPPLPGQRRRRWLWPVAGGCLAVALGVGVYAALDHKQSDPAPESKPATVSQTAEQKSGQSPEDPKTSGSKPAEDLNVFDKLRHREIPHARLVAAGQGNARKAAKEIVAIYGGPKLKVSAFALHPDGKTLAAVMGGRIHLIDLATGQQRIWPKAVREVRQLCFSHDGKLLALGASMNSLVPTSVWDVVSGERKQVLDPKAVSEGSLAFSPDDRQIFWVRQGQSLNHVWVTGRAPQEAAPPPGPLEAIYPMQTIALSPDGHYLAASSVTRYETAYVQLWDVHTGKVLGKTNQKMRGASRLVFTPDSTRLAQVHAHVNEVPVFDVATRKKSGAFAGQNITDICFSPKGDLAATCTWSGEIGLWDTKTFANQRILTIRPPDSGHESGGIRTIQFAPDGRHVLTRNHDGTLYIVRLFQPPVKTERTDTQ